MVKFRVVRLVIIGVSAILVVNLLRSIWDLWRRRDILGERQSVLKRLEAENTRLKGELSYSESPFFVEQEARNRLGLGREGETVVLMPNVQFPISSIQKKTDEETIPNWKRWWNLFF